LALVEVLRDFVEQGRPLEAAFSRARSFSKKLQRKGGFVPRGMSAQQYKQEQAGLEGTSPSTSTRTAV
jgi:hypothetical protein